MTDREPKPRPIHRYRVKERIIRCAPDEPLTPGLRKQTFSPAIGFVHHFDESRECDDE